MVYVGNKRLFTEHGIELNGIGPALDALHERGETAVLVGGREGVRGVVALADRPRAVARETVEALRRSGVEHVVILTGDNRRAASAIAREVGVTEVEAELMPGEKVEAVGRLVGRYGSVAMVGDGVNDAPALATATVGIAMGVAGTDAALEVADMALVSDDLSRIPYAVELSRRTLRTIQANVAISLATKALALVLAMFGMLPLWGAIAADMGVSLLVTLNGMRLLAYRG
jgi:Cd2+/Zn2+-exporting ATPase